MPKLGKFLCVMTSLALWQGCSSTSDSSDGSASDAATDTATDAPTGFLSRGMNNYVVTVVTVVKDECEANPAALRTHTLPVNNVVTGQTDTLSVGTQVGAPLQPSLGSGVVGFTGTLNRENDVTDGTCSWHQKDVSLFNLTGGDVFTLDVTETQSAFSGCGTTAPAIVPCTSQFSLTFATPTPISTDGGSGG